MKASPLFFLGRYRLSSSFGALALAMLAGAMPATALAQTGPAPAAEAPAPTAVGPADLAAAEEVIITGSRVSRPGYLAPTPTTVVGAEQMGQQGITNVADLLNNVPAFRGSASPSANSFTFANSGGNFVNLRNLGANRTLVLLDGRRVVPSTATGTVDLNLIPSIALERTEIVTGGASAAYGSDAIAGVVNLLLRKNFNGLLGEARYGESKYGDGKTYTASFVAGSELIDGVHVLVAGEYERNEGVGTLRERDWARRNLATMSGPGGTTILAPGINFSVFAPGGLINGGPLRGTTFDDAGHAITYHYGNNYGVPGALQSGGDFPLAYFSEAAPLRIPTKRYSGLLKLDADVTDSIKATLELNYGYAGGSHNTVMFLRSVTLQPDNAYLPASIRSLITGPISVGKIGMSTSESDLKTNVSVSNNETARAVFGLQGELGGGWKWDTHYEHGQNIYYSALKNDVLDWLVADQTKFPSSKSPFSLALDAVVNPANGQIVCRSSLTNPTNGCVPINILGTTNVTDAARNYVTGTAWQRLKTKQDNFAANISGEPFSTWAGPVSFATGYEYRRDSIKGKSDVNSQNSLWDLYNPNPVKSGSISVNEGYAEVVVPLLKDVAIAKSLEFNGALRYAHYNLAGGATTWKAGLGWQVNDDLRLRGSRSRDIRAPNLSENFASAQVSQGVAVGYNPPTMKLIAGGNTNLTPEISDTTSVGISYAPRWFRGFHASVDYYNISIKDAIATPPVLSILNGCVIDKNDDFCSRIVFDPADPTRHTIVSVNVAPENVNKVKTSGFDIDIGYNFGALGGEWSLSALGSYLAHISDTGTGGFNRAGQINGGLISPGIDGPRWVWNANVNYARGPLGLNANVRFISSGVLDVTAKPGGINANKLLNADKQPYNKVASRAYLNLAFTYDLPIGSKKPIQLFGGINNVLNTDPPKTIGFVDGYFRGYAAQYYDPIGMNFFGGIRIRM